jgi:hypothetical protein
MPNATGLTSNKITTLAAWNNMLRKHYNEERKASQNLPGPNIPALPNNSAAVARNNKIINQARNNVNGVPPTATNANRVAAIAQENTVLANKVLPAAVAVNNNALKVAANNNDANMRKLFGN